MESKEVNVSFFGVLATLIILQTVGYVYDIVEPEYLSEEVFVYGPLLYTAILIIAAFPLMSFESVSKGFKTIILFISAINIIALSMFFNYLLVDFSNYGPQIGFIIFLIDFQLIISIIAHAYVFRTYLSMETLKEKPKEPFDPKKKYYAK